MRKHTGQKLTLQITDRRHTYITSDGKVRGKIEFRLELSRQESAPRPSNKKKSKSVVVEAQEEEPKIKPFPKSFVSGM